MILFLLRRLLQAVTVLALVSLVLFALMWMLPGGPRQTMAGGAASPVTAAALRHDYGIGEPAAAAYVNWIGQVLSGNLGYSYVENASVGSLLTASLPRTLVLMSMAYLLAAVVAVPAGLLQAARRNSAADLALRGLAYLGNGMPAFFLGALLIYLLAVRAHLFGAEGPQAAGLAGVVTDWRDLTLPVITLAALAVAMFSRYIRAAALGSLTSDYVRTARASGAGSSRVTLRHVLKNSVVPVITLAGLSVPQIMAGAVVVESLFNIRGVGWELWQAALKHDFPVLLGFILVVGCGAVLGSLIADVGYSLADPRVRPGRS